MSGLITASALTSGTVTLDASGDTSADTIHYSNPNSFTSVATSNTVRKLALSGSNIGNNIFNGAFANNIGTSNAATLTKNGTGTVTFGGSGGFSGTSASFIDGVLTGVSVTPSVAGSDLTFTVDDGEGHTGTTTIATIQTLYVAWSDGAAFDADSNDDGIANGLAWLLGAANPNQWCCGHHTRKRARRRQALRSPPSRTLDSCPREFLFVRSSFQSSV